LKGVYGGLVHATGERGPQWVKLRHSGKPKPFPLYCLEAGTRLRGRKVAFGPYAAVASTV
jgi:hypothetical protein